MLNPAGTTPVLLEEGRPAVPGATIIAEYLDETRGDALDSHRLLPADVGGRVEVRRLLSWFNDKFFAEVSGPLLLERILKRRMTAEQGGGSPEPNAIRAALSNIRYHLDYISWLVRTRALACRRPPKLCGFCRGGAFVGDRLSGRRAVEPGRGRQELVCTGQVTAVVPAAAQRHLSGSRAVQDLRGSRLLTARADIKPALTRAAAALGFDAIAVAAPTIPPEAARRSCAIFGAGHARRYGLDGGAARAARRSAYTMAAGARDRDAWGQLRPAARPPGGAGAARPRRHFGLCHGRRLS